MILVMIGSYWINELVIKPYVFGDKSGAKLNPFEGLTGTAKARTQAAASQGYVQQPMQGQNLLQQKTLKINLHLLMYHYTVQVHLLMT